MMDTNTPQLLDGYVSEREAAPELKKCQRTMQRWRRQGIGPPWTKIGNRIYYRVDAVKRWLREQEVEPPRQERAP